MPDLPELYDELKRGRIYECSLRDKRWRLDGLQDGESIYIDPRPSIIETLLHELLHRRCPRWGERRVTREARLMIVRMDDAALAFWWRAYQRQKRKGRPVEVAD